MPYQQNLGYTYDTPADVRPQVSVSWTDISAAALAQFLSATRLAPPYNQAIVSNDPVSRTGPGAAYPAGLGYPAGTIIDLKAQHGDWLATDRGDYILKRSASNYDLVKAAAEQKAAAEALKAAKVAGDAQIKAAIANVTPAAISQILSEYRFPPAGITQTVIKDLVNLVKGRIIYLAVLELGGDPGI